MNILIESFDVMEEILIQGNKKLAAVEFELKFEGKIPTLSPWKRFSYLNNELEQLQKHHFQFQPFTYKEMHQLVFKICQNGMEKSLEFLL